MHAWRDSQKALTEHLPDEGVIWIIGTGSGAFLKTLESKCHFVSIDPSHKMTRLARKNLWHLDVHYVQNRHDQLNFRELPAPDVIVCPFFLQLLQSKDFLKWHKDLRYHFPKQMTYWLYTDFEIPQSNLHRFWQWPYLYVMFIFLWITTGKPVFRLSDWPKILQSINYQCIESKSFAHGLVWMRVFQQTD
jgi:hypothetical protein